MDDVYVFLANKIIELVRDPSLGDEYIFYESERTGRYGILYKRDYSGLMAKPPRTGPNTGKIKKKRQGLFDMEILTGTRSWHKHSRVHEIKE